MELRAAEGETRGLCSQERAREGAAVGVAAVSAGGGGSASSSSFAHRCMGLVKEQRERLYITRRCITMLACQILKHKPQRGLELIAHTDLGFSGFARASWIRGSLRLNCNL
ncbi:hypothetical protein SETIT_3G218100v2 [Setaria italica]|uniref:Uncharacterized protein n=1 Tax=Setaria italica TaxID=4555 RepID=A0A368QHY4_SETIT|nr:hypothetical protein SETIT_3G218100v2 [Setaria italica]